MHAKSDHFEHLLTLLAEPELFNQTKIPVGREYLYSPQKVIVDIALCIGVIPFTTLPTIAGALAIPLIDGEKPLFIQERIGQYGEPFRIFKLRTMPGDNLHTHSNGRHDDPRRSKLGKLLSLLRIDESPQLVNVALGDMSVIGPRPLLGTYLEKVRHVLGPKKADEWIAIRSLAKPGIFDEFAVMHHSDELIDIDPAEQLLLRADTEIRYVLDEASVANDLRIMAKTLELFGQTAIQHTARLLPGRA